MRALPAPIKRSLFIAPPSFRIICAPFPSLCSCMFPNSSLPFQRTTAARPSTPLPCSVAPHLNPVVLPVGDVDVGTCIGGDPVGVLKRPVGLSLGPEGPDVGGHRLRRVDGVDPDLVVRGVGDI